MILFRGRGPQLFRMALETALRSSAAQRKWYLSVIDEMARSIPVWTCSMKGLAWCEVDYHADLKQAEKVVTACGVRGEVEADPPVEELPGGGNPQEPAPASGAEDGPGGPEGAVGTLGSLDLAEAVREMESMTTALLEISRNSRIEECSRPSKAKSLYTSSARR